MSQTSVRTLRNDALDQPHEHCESLLPRRSFIRRLGLCTAAIVGLTFAWPSKSRAGYGQCSVYGCNCQAYVGSGNTCENCGHAYSSHW